VRSLVPALLVSIASAGLIAQDAAQPRFRTGVELLTLQAAVVDSSGRPVADLDAADFTVTVDGRPRKVAFARFYRADAATAAAGPVRSVAAGSVANTTTAAGRVIVFVIDRDSIRSEADKAAFEAATSILDSLSPADAVGLLSLPAGGVEVTREHAKVRAALLKMTGSQTLAVPDPDTRQPLWALRNLARNLQGLRAPKHIILVSGGLPFSMDLLADYQIVAQEAAAAGVVLHAIHLDQGASGASDRLSPSLTPNNERRAPGASPRPEANLGGRELGSGLSTLAGMTGGTFFTAVARGTGVFERVNTVINNFYELAIEGEPADSDGKGRKVSVTVNRSGVTVRAPEQVATPRGKDAAGDRLLALLKQPTDLAELPVSVTAFTTRGSEAGSLRVSLSADIGTAATPAPTEWAFFVFDRKEALVADGRQTLDASAPRPWSVTASAQLAPGAYTLRVAALDHAGRAALITTPLTVGLRAVGPIQASDVILGVAEGGSLKPLTRLTARAQLVALVELVSADPAALATTRAAFEIVPGGTAEPVHRVLMAARSGQSDAVLLNEARVDTARLPPGRYTASVVVLVNNQPQGRITRAFEIVGK
jgi:VWFA-related protein